MIPTEETTNRHCSQLVLDEPEPTASADLSSGVPVGRKVVFRAAANVGKSTLDGVAMAARAAMFNPNSRGKKGKSKYTRKKKRK